MVGLSSLRLVASPHTDCTLKAGPRPSSQASLSTSMSSSDSYKVSHHSPVVRKVSRHYIRADPIFRATQDITFNERVIAASESTIKSCEQELLTLKDVDAGTADWMGSRTAVRDRMNYLLKKMRTAGDKIEMLEKENARLRKVLSK